MKFSIPIIFIGIVAGASFFYLKHYESIRTPASDLVFDNQNIQILRSIPLVKNVENPEKDEEEITLKLIEMFDSFAERNADEDGKLNRGTHAKGKCFPGQIEILSHEQLESDFKFDKYLIEKLKRGLWKNSGIFPVSIRFANADGMGRKQDDRIGDVRSFSFAIEDLAGIKTFSNNNRQDFMFNSTPEFASGGIREFLEVVKMANIAVYHDFTYLPNLSLSLAAIHDISLINKGNNAGKNLKSLSKNNYWANLPYTHGIDPNGNVLDLVKYKATPCSGKGVEKLPNTDRLSKNYLQEEIVRAAQTGEVCMIIQIQFFDINKMNHDRKWTVSKWIEEGGLAWDEKILPFHTIAKVIIPKNTKEISCSDQYINTRLNSNPMNQPIGSIARVRTFVEENSRARRMIDK